jgi:CelD/BcsL family acetyltransferase involved in cellulose biosynthesis
VVCYDFLRGSAAYKQRLSTGVRPLLRLRVVRPTVRSGLWAVAAFARRVVRWLVVAGARMAGALRRTAARGTAA